MDGFFIKNRISNNFPTFKFYTAFWGLILLRIVLTLLVSDCADSPYFCFLCCLRARILRFICLLRTARKAFLVWLHLRIIYTSFLFFMFNLNAVLYMKFYVNVKSDLFNHVLLVKNGYFYLILKLSSKKIL
jgi:hypothetical protein